MLAGVSVLAILAGTTVSDAASFSYTDSIVTYTIPDTGTYDLKAAGAQGGDSFFGLLNTKKFGTGGKGALMEGTFSFIAGDILRILVGGAGGLGMSAGGGGGGSFIATLANAPLLVAGGGGGAGGETRSMDGGYGWNLQKGMPGSSGGEGGYAGAGGGSGAHCNSAIRH